MQTILLFVRVCADTIKPIHIYMMYAYTALARTIFVHLSMCQICNANQTLMRWLHRVTDTRHLINNESQM